MVGLLYNLGFLNHSIFQSNVQYYINLKKVLSPDKLTPQLSVRNIKCLCLAICGWHQPWMQVEDHDTNVPLMLSSLYGIGCFKGL